MESDEYRTIEAQSEGMYKEKGSKFIARAFPASSPDEVKHLVESVRKQYHDARHHCYAYRLGAEPYEFRYNDDGEPSGTAGKPIFGQIQSLGLTNTLVVVTRYFGGVKLGTGGLIQAYKTAARLALENASVLTKTWKVKASIRFQYAQMDQVMRVIKDESLDIIGQEAYEDCCITLEIRTGKTDLVRNKLMSIESVNWNVI
jgi:uncharacterized YigZ family protein